MPWQPCLLAYAAGIMAIGYWLAALIGLALLVLFPRPSGGRPTHLALTAAFLLGLGAGYGAMPSRPQTVPVCLSTRARLGITGTVVSVNANPDDRLAVVLDTVSLQGPKDQSSLLPGRLSLTLDQPTFRPLPGDILHFSARIRAAGGFQNPGTTDFAFTRRLEDIFYRAYARGEEVHRVAASHNRAAGWRERLRQRVADSLAPPEGADATNRAGRAMVLALIFGDRSGLTAADTEVVRRASLAHTLALSGMHVGFVAAAGAALALLLGRLFPGLYLRLPRPHLAVLFGAPLVAIYCWLGGGSPSLLRAAFMFASFGLLLAFRRDRALLDGLFAALAVILLWTPLAVFDPRLTLSALAVAGIGLFWPSFHQLSRHLPFKGKSKTWLLWVGGTLWTSLCAEAAVLPLINRLYGDWMPNPWINLLWLPILGGVAMPLALGGVALIALPGLGGFAGWLLQAAALCCQGLMRLLNFLDSHHLLLSYAVLRPNWPETLGCLGLLAALAVTLSTGKRPLAALLASLALLLGPTAWHALEDMHGAVRLTVLDVGQGQAVAISLPGGRRLLVDAGGLFGNFDVGRAVVGAFLTDGRAPRLDMAFASHPHTDHIKGYVSLLRRFAVGAYYDNGGTPEGALAAPMAEALTSRHIPHVTLNAGDTLELGDGLVLSVLHPGPEDDRAGNNGSLILRLTWNGHGLAVIPGDAERGVLRRLAASGAKLSAAMLVLPHHGSSSSLAKRFLHAVGPRIAVASCGDNGRYPSSKVVDALAGMGCSTRATNRDGAVTVRFTRPTAPPEIETAAIPPPLEIPANPPGKDADAFCQAREGSAIVGTHGDQQETP